MRALASLFLAISSGRRIGALCRAEDLAQSLDSVWSKEFTAAGNYCLANVTPADAYVGRATAIIQQRERISGPESRSRLATAPFLA